MSQLARPSRLKRRRSLPVLACAFAMLAAAPLANGAASQTGATLTVAGTFGPDLIELNVLPSGVVEILNAPGVVSGTTFSGVDNVVVRAENNSDNVVIKAESSMRFLLDTSTGADSVKVEVIGGTTGVLAVDIDAYTATNSDSVEVLGTTKGAALDIDVLHDMSTNDDAVKVEITGEGQAPYLNARLRTIGSTGSDTAEMLVTSDSPLVNVDLGVNPDFYGYRTGPTSSKLVVDHKAAGVVRANLSMLTASGAVELKGADSTKIVNGTVKGGGGPDSLFVFTEGPSSGNLVVDGGSGFDSCTTTVGIRVNCES